MNAATDVLTCSADFCAGAIFFRHFWKCIQLPDHFQWISRRTISNHFCVCVFVLVLILSQILRTFFINSRTIY